VGLVAQPIEWTLEELFRFPAVDRTIDIHCVTRWSMLGTAWRGVPLRTLLAESCPTVDARFLSFSPAVLGK
jgi:DMSO/TMAO reductase YedYZ molybdopterin-dependent catalytic subunit